MKDINTENRNINMDTKYDAWLIWNVTERCNMTCNFCSRNISKLSLVKTFKIDSIGLIPSFILKKLRYKFYAPKKIDISMLMRTLEKTNKTFKISLTGGEPFLCSDIIRLCSELTKRHYITLNTNLTYKNIKEFTNLIDPERVVHFHASLHIKELERLNLMDRFIDNFLLCKDNGFNIFAEEVGHPSLLGEVEKYKEFFKEKGIDLKFGHFFGEYEQKIYPKAYTKKEIEIFDLDKTYLSHFYQKGKICNAGYNVGVISNIIGDIQPCYQINKNIGNIYKEIKFSDRTIKCPFKFCSCPIKIFDDHLFKKAIEEK